jgi:hypothetical protein
MFQNGSVFNELCGTFMSVFVFWVILKAPYAAYSEKISIKSNISLSEKQVRE